MPREQQLGGGQQTHQRADRHRGRIQRQAAIADGGLALAISAPSLAAAQTGD